MIRALLAGLLRLAPGAFRARHGEELIEVHLERAGRPAALPWRLWFAAREVLGMTRLVVRLWLGGAPGTMTTGTRTGGGVTMWETTRQNLRLGLRTLRRDPGFALAAILVLALGIGANTAIFSAVNAYFFRPLPFGDADRLVMLYETNPEFGWDYGTAAPANVLDWREQVDAFEDIAIYTEFVSPATHIRDGEPELLHVNSVSGNFFDVMGVRPALGEGLTWENTWQGNDGVVVLSHGLWVSHFGADPGVVGRTLEFGATTVEIVGVMPEGFAFPNDRIQLWTPWGWPPENREEVWFRRAHWVRPIARLAPGVTPAEADAQLQVVVGRLQTDFPETNRVMGAGLMPLRDFLIMDVRRPLLILLGAVGLLLILACTNVANLMLVRATERVREVALRYALGAGRRQVVGQMLTESLVMGLAGGLAGLGLGWVGIRALATRQQSAIGIEGATALALDWRVLLFTMAAAGMCAALFGSAPAIRTTRASDVQDALKDGGRGGSTGREGIRTVSTLVMLEVALALVLVVGAGLMVRSFWLMRGVDPGFRTEGVLAVQFGIPSTRYQERDQVLAFQDDFQRRIEGRAGIHRAGLVGQLPLNGTSWSSQFQAEGWPPDRVGFDILHRRADPGYFEAMRIPLLKGRLFEPTDEPDAPMVVVVNERFAEEYFPGEDPIGQRIAYDRAAADNPECCNWYEIVGIVGNQQQVTPREPARAEVFESRHQDWTRSDWWVIHTDGDPMAALPAVREVLREMDPLIPLGEVRPVREVWRASMAREELILSILGAFGVVALLLATVGVYGVTAQAARRRTQEIGIRMALGAGAGDVVAMMLRQGLAVVAVGLVLGLAGALLATRAMASVLFGVAPTDPGTIAAVVALLGGVAAVACYVPARRATTVDPADSLRAE
ncbi:MAG TPA: ABC transporter permease [Longimicrobiales bacterium]